MAVDLTRRLGMLTLALIASHAAAMGPAAPFTPPKVEEVQAAAVEQSYDNAPGLSGLRLHNHPMALIDGHWARVGDTVRNARVTAIDRTGALLRHPDGRTERLSWNNWNTRP